MKNTTTAVFLASTLFVCSCSNVTTSYPLGETDLQMDAEEWDGLWLSADGSLLVLKVVEASTGSLDVYWLDEESDTPVLRRSPTHLGESHGWIFASIPDEDSDDAKETPDYIWARVVKKEETLTLWLPDASKFRRLIEEERLPGSTSDGVQLGMLETSHYALITSEAEGVLFDWEEPYQFRRVAR